jgi:hypothetical protein
MYLRSHVVLRLVRFDLHQFRHLASPDHSQKQSNQKLQAKVHDIALTNVNMNTWNHIGTPSSQEFVCAINN